MQNNIRRKGAGNMNIASTKIMIFCLCFSSVFKHTQRHKRPSKLTYVFRLNIQEHRAKTTVIPQKNTTALQLCPI